MAFSHRSVLLNEAVTGLNIRPDGIYVDGTLGGAGHSAEIVRRLTTGRLIGIDQDEDAIAAATERLKDHSDKVTIVHNNFENIREVLNDLGIDRVDGILLDLGVSSYQFDEGDRGFSYRIDAPLDMRMDRQKELTAAFIVNQYSESELYRIIRDYGEEPFAKNIAKHIVQYREQEPIRTTFQLVDIIKSAIPAKIRAKGGHPAKQTFQAIRIECNRELDVLQTFLRVMVDALNENGRIAIITFHSLEDRIVKNAFRTFENPCTCPKNLPCVCGKKPLGRVITRKPILPSEEEMNDNPRSKSAKLRIFEKV
ncbi:MAG: 16S rRNA (cytosine(1402)-N(4))-methyltransferase RsmH [Lachnospiraceae bacterium]|nr:16S rRNA (cytosine(1402)-N(4))-methyltransferase RsmH [Lachnospiraceae bacterium]MBR3037021.1 16S rRNA (cytosine(1402)-N(4))-methyltransferase RsmH [Lachnospiraceae bacterium]